jgi:hypothetical protein
MLGTGPLSPVWIVPSAVLIHISPDPSSPSLPYPSDKPQTTLRHGGGGFATAKY